jgi:hypothetical protein
MSEWMVMSDTSARKKENGKVKKEKGGRREYIYIFVMITYSCHGYMG